MKIKPYTLLICLTLTNLVAAQVRTGADRLSHILPLLNKQQVALIVNHTSVTSNNTHLLDTLLAKGVNVKRVFAPEHGFRGTANAGEKVLDSRDSKTGIPIISLYGKNRKPQTEQLADIDVVIFDIQDVGARFYTYISTMFYAMQKCAEMGKKMIVLDRPNPNDHVAGPILKDEHKSFVGTLPIPVQHGLTVGELALMCVGEKWIGNASLSLVVVPAEGWRHGQPYSLLVKPSPNLPNDVSIALYPSLCFFEATKMSVGRGTLFPFQVIGYPDQKFGNFSFTPQSLPEFEKNPLQNGNVCYGIDLRDEKSNGKLTLKYLLDYYSLSSDKNKFISSPDFFDKLMGDAQVRFDILAGKSETEITKRWKDDLKKYNKLRKKYLLYPDYLVKDKK